MFGKKKSDISESLNSPAAHPVEETVNIKVCIRAEVPKSVADKLVGLETRLYETGYRSSSGWTYYFDSSGKWELS